MDEALWDYGYKISYNALDQFLTNIKIPKEENYEGIIGDDN